MAKAGEVVVLLLLKLILFLLLFRLWLFSDHNNMQQLSDPTKTRWPSPTTT